MSSYLERHSDVEGMDLLLGRYIADYDDPDNFTYVLFHSTAGIFRKYFCCPEVDQLTEEARIESRSNLREKLYREVENRLLQQHHLLPLFHDIDYRLASPRVRRLKLRSNPPYVNYPELGKIEDVEPFTPRKSGGGTIEIPIPGEISTLDPSIAFLVGQIEVIPT